jgi:hypothetical protein
MSATSYVHPEVLADTQWTEEHINDSKVKVAEVDSRSRKRTMGTSCQ